MTIQIRRSNYRGQDGYLVCGTPRDPALRRGWSAAVFTLTRVSAERIRDKLNRGEQIGRADFESPSNRTPDHLLPP